MSNIKDINLAPSGADKIAWVASYMPILNAVKAEFERTLPFRGKKIAMSIHLEAKTAYLAKVLREGEFEDGILRYGDVEFSSLVVDVEWLDVEALSEVVRLAEEGLPVIIPNRYESKILLYRKG